ncbi:hypothetical protein MPL1032_180054 [Mesorhizobium plurifarium]|uniref:Uncharacterized protein n=1 Tax=Mesorhizobium plurifarium TaxID=69974 RepID=A0A0K2VTI3_MESPL|nr:hypothetical protein MPL1032_180054 [Mesorhizobium plurifarium]
MALISSTPLNRSSTLPELHTVAYFDPDRIQSPQIWDFNSINCQPTVLSARTPRQFVELTRKLLGYRFFLIARHEVEESSASFTSLVDQRQIV